MNNERQRHILYDAKGNLKLGGLFYLLWEDFHKPLLYIICGIVVFCGYNKALLALNGDQARSEAVDHRSEAEARQSGKLKADRFLVKPKRQIDDPDFLNIPSYGGKGVYQSKLFEGDEASSDPLHSERRRN